MAAIKRASGPTEHHESRENSSVARMSDSEMRDSGCRFAIRTTSRAAFGSHCKSLTRDTE